MAGFHLSVLCALLQYQNGRRAQTRTGICTVLETGPQPITTLPYLKLEAADGLEPP